MTDVSFVDVDGAGRAKPITEAKPIGQAKPIAESTLVTRPLAAADVAAVHAIDRASYVDPWPEHQIAAEVERSDRCHIVALRGPIVVGHASLLVVEPEATLTTIAVAPTERGTGVARELLLDLCHRAVARGVEALTLEVRSTNSPAHALYRRFGFAPVGIRRGYYPATGSTPADDALIMWADDIHQPDYQHRLAAIAAAVDPARKSELHHD